MARLKNELRNCKFCSHKKTDIENLCYYCSNRQSEHYLEKIKEMIHLCVIARAVIAGECTDKLEF